MDPLWTPSGPPLDPSMDREHAHNGDVVAEMRRLGQRWSKRVKEGQRGSKGQRGSVFGQRVSQRGSKRVNEGQREPTRVKEGQLQVSFGSAL
jgi:hypothetical protein